MKKHHRLVSLASALLLALAALPCTAMAAEAGDTEPAQGAPPPAALYPAEVRTSEENGMIRLEKVYYLSTRDDPAAIPTGDFDREGRHYTLLDVLKNDLSETDSKDYIEVVTLDSSTKDMAEIIKTLEPEREIATEDGYTGILKPDYTKITVEAAGYKNNSWTVSAKRTYPNLSDADASLIPKTSQDTVIYTAVFSAENASHGETHLDPEPTATPEGGEPQQTQPPEPAQDSGGSVAGKIVVTALAGIAALAIIGYGGWRGYKFIRDKKRGYV